MAVRAAAQLCMQTVPGVILWQEDIATRGRSPAAAFSGKVPLRGHRILSECPCPQVPPCPADLARNRKPCMQRAHLVTVPDRRAGPAAAVNHRVSAAVQLQTAQYPGSLLLLKVHSQNLVLV